MTPEKNLAVLILALLWDLLLGEPPFRMHPVVWLGRVISRLEQLAPQEGRCRQLLFGALITMFLTTISFSIPYLVLRYLGETAPIVGVVVGAFLLKSSFSLKELGRSARHVEGALSRGELEKAREELRALVSRDTRDLDRPLLASAAVESVAENVCDSFVAPIFYFLLLGVPGAMAYRAVNTMDAMLGYHGKYEYLGKFAARLDDVLNYIPARISGGLIGMGAFILGKDCRRAWSTMLQEHRATESPNAGWTMAAMAGALGVCLEKRGHYRLAKDRPYPTPSTIGKAVGIVMGAAFVWSIISIAINAARCLVAA